LCGDDPGSVNNPTCAEMSDGQAWVCLNYCLPLVPNGCDCFGCCKITDEGPGDTGYRFIGSPGCTLETMGNCELCSPVPSCENTCGACELCIGKTELPPGCIDKPEERCDPGVTPCGQPGDSGCAPGYACITGCCKRSIILE
jgi:hypothetical protein